MDKLIKILEENANEENSRQMKAYMRNQFDFYGIKTPLRRSLSKPYLLELKKKEEIDWDFIYRAWARDQREYVYIALDYLKSVEKKLVYEDMEKIKYLVETKSWWDSVDGLHRSVGKLSLRDDRMEDLMVSWSLDENFWVRRLAIDHQLHLKDKTRPDLLEEIIVNNLNSEEFFINKAIGWSLRDYSKTKPSWVRNFLDKYEKDLDRLSIREAKKYLD